MVKVKGCSGKGAMKTLHYSLDVDAWNEARVPVMRHLLQTRWSVDAAFHNILVATGTTALRHTDRGGIRSFWGCSDKGGKNMFGKLLVELRNKSNV